MKFMQKIRAIQILKEITKGLNERKNASTLMQSLIALKLNNIKSNACAQMIDNKIDPEFYCAIFEPKGYDMYHPWFEVNENLIRELAQDYIK